MLATCLRQVGLTAQSTSVKRMSRVTGGVKLRRQNCWSWNGSLQQCRKHAGIFRICTEHHIHKWNAFIASRLRKLILIIITVIIIIISSSSSRLSTPSSRSSNSKTPEIANIFLAVFGGFTFLSTFLLTQINKINVRSAKSLFRR